MMLCIARAYFSEQYMNVTVEKYDLTEKKQIKRLG